MLKTGAPWLARRGALIEANGDVDLPGRHSLSLIQVLLLI